MAIDKSYLQMNKSSTAKEKLNHQNDRVYAHSSREITEKIQRVH